MAQYMTGTVSTTAASAVITGLGTLWVASISAGDEILIGSDEVYYIVLTVDTNVQITLTANYHKTVVGVNYIINSDFSANRGYPLPAAGAMNLPEMMARALIGIDRDVVPVTLYAYDPKTTVGLDFGYGAGRMNGEGSVILTVAGTVTLTDDDTNYVEVSPAGVVSANVIGWTAGSLPLYEVTTVSGNITAYNDKRSWATVPGAGLATYAGMADKASPTTADSVVIFDAAAGHAPKRTLISKLIALAQTAITPTGTIRLWYGSIATIPSGWQICDGTTGTPDLRGKMVIGAGGTYAVDATGGAETVSIAEANLPAHVHTIAHTHSLNAHTHSTPNHAHVVASHTHTGPSHSHTANAHSHSLNAHAHSISAHSHTIGNHLHSAPVHWHSINNHTHTIAADGAHSHLYNGLYTGTLAASGYGYGATSATSSTEPDHSHGGVTGSGGAATNDSPAASTGSTAPTCSTIPTANTGASSGDTGTANPSTNASGTAATGGASPDTDSSGASTSGPSTGSTAASSATNSGTVGSGTALASLPPYHALAWIMRI